MATLPVVTRFTLNALIDDFPLTAQRFDPPEGVPLRAATVISCATGVDAKFYNDFAFWLAQHGVGVITYDYRYNGLSWPAHLLDLVGSKSTPESRAAAYRAVPEDVGITSHWAQRDASAAICQASTTWPNVPLTSVGNSLGGLILPLCHSERHRITRYLNVCGGNLWVGNYRDPREVLSVFKKLVLPFIERDRIFYATRIGLGNDIPYGPGKEWVQWFLSPRCAQSTPHTQRITKELDKPYLFIGFEDDPLCLKRLMETQMPHFSHADGFKASLWIDPAKQNPPWPMCGHINSFMKSRPAASGPPSIVSNGGPTVGSVFTLRPVDVADSTLARAETIWPVYKDWIIYGRVDQSIGEYRVWKPEDEFNSAETAKTNHKAAKL